MAIGKNEPSIYTPVHWIIHRARADVHAVVQIINTNLIEKYQDSEIAIDMTPGRKYMSSIAMGLALTNRKIVNKLYYLHLEIQGYQDSPFIKIPLPFQNLIFMVPQ